MNPIIDKSPLKIHKNKYMISFVNIISFQKLQNRRYTILESWKKLLYIT